MALERSYLEKWTFALGEEMECLAKGREVVLPHTWNIEAGTEDYAGYGWYAYDLHPEASWEGKIVEVYFHAVYHDAVVYLNGEEIFTHENSGYTPFTVSLTGKLAFGRKNILVVRADNRYSDTMLPVRRSFDWANDGGMIRPAELMIYGNSKLENLKITAKPVIVTEDERQDDGSAVFGFSAMVAGDHTEASRVAWEVSGLHNAVAASGETTCEDGQVKIPGQILENISFWHFDAPNLYTLKLQLKNNGILDDQQEITFGFRDFHVKGPSFYLNGEKVRVCGTEWMPGSDPDFGSAETKEQLEKMLTILRNSNCVFTRFHWQQDDWVYDWCDRHGMLVQEEVPFWGKDPEKAEPQQLKIFKEQIQEMVKEHGNHPSIVMWGVGNELDGQGEVTTQYVKDAVHFAHELDKNRPANYVSNSCFNNPAVDAATDGDVMMINDYIGTWHGDLGQYKMWDWITKLNPDRAMVPSEFGLCEPAFDGGDTRRIEVFKEKMECYRKYPNIAGTINFCLNDYRTQMGEDGEGKLKKRVHGSTDLCGVPKPSYWVVRDECAPVTIEEADGKLAVSCRDTLPSYTVKGYMLEVKGEGETSKTQIPVLKPGEKWLTDIETKAGAQTVSVYTGEILVLQKEI
ncbi:MAG: hypothetical protein EOM40_04405 [Clostridia bacterium]|nr:hypothetical protein [Clostridia bacterium]NCC42032.1 hypothetical protein [Clostridia bacterium]